MLGYKLRTGGHILWCLARGNVRTVARGFARGPLGGVAEVYRAVVRLVLTVRAIFTFHGKFRVSQLVGLCVRSGVPREWLAPNPEAVFVIAEELNSCQKYDDILAMTRPHLETNPDAHKMLAVRGMAYLGLGRYPEALADLTRASEINPTFTSDLQFDLFRAYLCGLRGDTAGARRAMAAQFTKSGDTTPPEPGLAAYLFARVCPLFSQKVTGSVGVVIGNFHNAVGHAILDPFHFIQLYAHRFDNFFMVHPDYEKYTPATRVAAHVLDQYVEQIETHDIHSLNFAWQNLGELTCENVTFLVHNYWSLNRMAFQARNDPDHPMAHGRHYFAYPPKLVTRAEAICRRNSLDLTRPMVVVHTREHGYHALAGQRYRNTEVRNYVPALRRLIDLGYQVVRIGDKKMTSIRHAVPGIVELPGTDYYDPVLDPYFISKCKFMISCQSGPCSYARVFGKPNLVLNAVYHYTLLPEQNELLAFKQYRDAATGELMSVDRIFQASAHLFDRTEHFERAGINVEDMTPEEISAATEEMLEWLDDPARPETAAQTHFRDRMRWFMDNRDLTHPLAHPLNDYIGYALPECRVSDAVCQLRPGYLPLPAGAGLKAA